MGEGLTLLSPHRPGGNPKKTFRGCVPGKMKRLGHVLNDFFFKEKCEKIGFFSRRNFFCIGVFNLPHAGADLPLPLHSIPCLGSQWDSEQHFPFLPASGGPPTSRESSARSPQPRRRRHSAGQPAAPPGRWLSDRALFPVPPPTSHPCDGRTLGMPGLPVWLGGGLV